MSTEEPKAKERLDWINYKKAMAYDVLKKTMDKIEDPRKRDHKEPDVYTQLGCVMNMAMEANKEADKIMSQKLEV